MQVGATPTRPDIDALLAADPVFGPLPQGARDTLRGAARVEQCDTPRLLNAAGQPLGWLRHVVEGHIEVIARHASGEEVALGDIGPGSWATWVGCLSPMPPEHDFYSSSEACYVAIPTSVVRTVCEHNPGVYPRVVAELGVRMRQLMEWTGSSVLLGPEQRMAKLIQLLARIHRVEGPEGRLSVTQARLARMARCSRQSANALLGALEKRGLISLAYGRCAIVDLARLQAFVEAEAPEGGKSAAAR